MDVIYFTCIITCYNREKLITRAIDSILAQTYPYFEILVVDDASTDHSVAVIEAYTDPRVKLIRHETNQGQNAGLNSGIKHAQYDFLAFLDSDDSWEPNYLLEMKQVYELNPESGFAYSHLVDGPYWTLEGAHKYADVLNQGHLSAMISITAKKNVALQAGGFDLRYRICQDDDFCFRMAKISSFKVIKKQLSRVHGNEDSMTNNTVAVAKGWAFLFKNYRRDILDFCGRNVYSKHLLSVAIKFFESAQLSKGLYYYFLSFGYMLFPSKKKYPFSFRDFWVYSVNILRMFYANVKKSSQAMKS